jgi:hypothetical protein
VSSAVRRTQARRGGASGCIPRLRWGCPADQRRRRGKHGLHAPARRASCPSEDRTAGPSHRYILSPVRLNLRPAWSPVGLPCSSSYLPRGRSEIVNAAKHEVILEGWTVVVKSNKIGCGYGVGCDCWTHRNTTCTGPSGDDATRRCPCRVACEAPAAVIGRRRHCTHPMTLSSPVRAIPSA